MKGWTGLVPDFVFVVVFVVVVVVVVVTDSIWPISTITHEASSRSSRVNASNGTDRSKPEKSATLQNVDACHRIARLALHVHIGETRNGELCLRRSFRLTRHELVRTYLFLRGHVGKYRNLPSSPSTDSGFSSGFTILPKEFRLFQSYGLLKDHR